MFAGKGAHGVGARCGAVGGGNGRAIELGNLEQVLAGPQLALELAELFDGLVDFSGLDAFGQPLPRCGLGLLIEFLSHTISLISRGRAPRVGARPVCTATCLVPSANKTERGDMLAEMCYPIAQCVDGEGFARRVAGKRGKVMGCKPSCGGKGQAFTPEQRPQRARGRRRRCPQ